MADKKKNNIFAAVGAATGLGNAFRFPALCVSYGAAFVIAYAVVLVAVCFPLMCAELSFGLRKPTGRGRKIWAFILRAAAVNSALIALYYGVIASKLGSACLSFAILGSAGTTTPPALAVFVFILLLTAIYMLLKRGSRALTHTGRVSVILSFLLFLPLAVAGIVRGKVFSSFDISMLKGGAVWADALGQALLALSLAAGVMPSFASARAEGFSVPRTAAAIIGANFIGCMLSMCATLPFVTFFPQTVGVNCALTVYPQVISALFPSLVAARIAGTAVFFVLTAVALHSLLSLANPAVSRFAAINRRAPLIFCALSALTAPLFAAHNLEALASCDRAACSVNAVIIAFSECLFFASRGNIRGANVVFIRFLCPVACGFAALFSLCSARFNCFMPLAAVCACLSVAAVFVGAVAPQLTRLLKSVKIKINNSPKKSNREKLCKRRLNT